MTFKKEFNEWVNAINKNENPPSEIIAYWFGLMETTEGFTMYVIGSREFDENDDDWACNNDFEPKNKYLDIPSSYSKDKYWKLS